MTGLDAVNEERLDITDYVPLYKQLSQILQQRIKAGVYKSSEKLPSERELIELFKVSRITATAAIQELVQNGLAYRKKGKGTFVSRPRIVGLSSFGSFSSDILQRGMTPSSRILELTSVPAEQDLMTHLGLEAGERCIKLSRVRYANDAPVAIETTYLPEKLVPGLGNEDLEKGSLFAVLLKSYGLHPSWSEGIFEAVSATPEQAELLNLKPGASVLLVHRVTVDNNDVPLEWAYSIYRADSFSFSTGRQAIES
jgi:GntR family transcriptional regulator